VRLPINLATTTTGHNRRNLVVRSSVIDAGYSYRFVADCSFAFLRWMLDVLNTEHRNSGRLTGLQLPTVYLKRYLVIRSVGLGLHLHSWNRY